MLVATKVLSRQIYFCRDKLFIIYYNYVCRDKLTFIATKTCLSRQNTSFVATKIILVASPANEIFSLLTVTSESLSGQHTWPTHTVLRRTLGAQASVTHEGWPGWPTQTPSKGCKVAHTGEMEEPLYGMTIFSD